MHEDFYKGMVVTDLDGTLFDQNAIISEKDRNCLNELKLRGILRVIATGRSLFSFTRSFKDISLIDYLIFSSGSGIFDSESSKIIQKINLSSTETNDIFETLVQFPLDFAILDPVPDNHVFRYFRRNDANPDFERRNKNYSGFYEIVDIKDFIPRPACQFLAVTDLSEGPQIYEKIRILLPDYKVIRSTSPIDHSSIWIEIYSKHVSKAKGIQYLARRFKVHKKDIFVLGNDYNDLDMLEWSHNSFVTANAPEALRKRFRVVSSNNENGFSEAVELWLKSKAV